MALTKQSIRRLKLMRHMLRWHWLYFPTVQFDLGYWARKKDRTGICGTAACAVGSAMYWKPFNLLGLTASISRKALGPFCSSAPRYKGMGGWTAVHEFFGISWTEAEYLFLDDKYDSGRSTTPRQVAKRITQFLKANK